MSKKEGRAKQIIKPIIIILAVIIYCVGAYAIIYPRAKIEIQEKNSFIEAESFLENVTEEHSKYEGCLESAQAAGMLTDGINEEVLRSLQLDIPYAELLSAMIAYNQEIYQNRQVNFSDAWSYAAQRFDLAQYGVQDGVVAVVDIPALEASFPVYLGATAEHMSMGLAQLTETSMPIGGKNTNCVLAGHRGWNNGKYLKDIEKVQLGDIITVTNLWYEMKYEVVDIKIIIPNDIQEVLIQDGRDLLTISTCHPYGSGGRYRYLVICERVEDKDLSTQIVIEDSSTLPINEQVQEIKQPVYISYFSSEKEILFDDIVFYVGVALIVLFPITSAIILLYRRRKK